MVLAGYDDEEADKVRKILGKKKVEEAKIEGSKFINAAIERGMDPKAAENLWQQMEEFARYSFNRAHASLRVRHALVLVCVAQVLLPPGVLRRRHVDAGHGHEEQGGGLRERGSSPGLSGSPSGHQ